jgi:hypothetical protein
MCAPRMTRHTSIRYSSFCHTRVNVGVSIFFTVSGRYVNYDEKQLTGENIFELFMFRKCVSYGFPIIKFCNPGVHYETPCISNVSEKNYPFFRILTNMRMEISTAASIHCRNYWLFGVTCISSIFLVGFFHSIFLSLPSQAEGTRLTRHNPFSIRFEHTKWQLKEVLISA